MFEKNTNSPQGFWMLWILVPGWILDPTTEVLSHVVRLAPLVEMDFMYQRSRGELGELTKAMDIYGSYSRWCPPNVM